MISRRSFLQAAAAPLALPLASTAQQRFTAQNTMTEWSYTSGKRYRDPLQDVELDVVFTSPGGEEHRVPAFWAGEQEWRVRFAPTATGRWTYRTACSDASNADLHGKT